MDALKYTLKRLLEGATSYRMRYHLPPGEGPGSLLTFDDGPLPATPDILRILSAHSLRAVFFMVADNVRKHPDIAREVLQAGHGIGSHGLAHHVMGHLGARAYCAEIAESLHVLQDVLGAGVRQFRPPYGRFGLRHIGPVLRMGLTLTMWSVHVDNDGRAHPIEPGAKTLEGMVARGRQIILLHDHTPSSVVSDVAGIVAAEGKRDQSKVQS